MSFTVGGDKNTNGMNSDGSTNTSQTGKGSTTISASNSGFEKEGVAKATVGEGNIATTSKIDGLNRDETQSMLVTKNERTGGLEGSITIDNSMLTNPKGYMESAVSGFKNTDPRKVSRDIDEKNGDAPAPNLGLGIFAKDKDGNTVDANTGLSTAENPNMNSALKYTVSDQSPLLWLLNRFVPGVHSASAYHDEGMKDATTGTNQVFIPTTIPQYFYYNYYGALGTMLRSDVTISGQPKTVQPSDK